MLDGQKNYTIVKDSSNLNQITIDSFACSEISEALKLGKIIVIHSSPIRFGAWLRSDYIVYDNETGE